MHKYGESKRLKFWWQLYCTSLPERDVRNIRRMDFCSAECTAGCSTRDWTSTYSWYSRYNKLQYQGLSLTSLLQLVWGVIFQHPSVTHTADVRHANWCSNFTGNFWAICPLVRAAEGRLLISKQWWSRNGSVWLVANIEPSFFCDGILKLVWRQDRLINVLAYFTGK